MAANRVFYLAALLGALGFYIAASPVWFSWVALFVLLLAPIVSLLLSLPQMRRLRLGLEAPESVEQGERLLLQLQLDSILWLPMPEFRLRLRIETAGDERHEYRYLRRIPRTGGTVWLETEQAGLLRVSASKLRVYDYLGLFRLPVKAPSATQTAVLPRAEEPTPIPDLEAFRTIRLAALPQGSYSEDHDHRPYREGDNARSIHWKLSQKTDDLIVREPVAPVRLRSFVVMDPPASLPELQSELAQLRWVSQWLSARALGHTVLWAGEHGTQAHEIAAEADILPMLTQACAAPVFKEAAPTVVVPEADWVCRIRPAGEVRP